MPGMSSPAIRPWSLGFAALLLAGTALAQAPKNTDPATSTPGAATSGPDAAPSDSGANFSYTSALEGYRGYAAQPVQSWRESNDTVGRIGGWRTYAREAQQGQAPGTEGAGGAADPHADHHGGRR